MSRGTFEQFKISLGEYQSANCYSAVDTSNRLGRFALDEHTLERIGLVNRDDTPTKNDYKAGWTGKYGITSTQQFLASPVAQDMALDDVLNWQFNTLSSVIHYDGQTLGGQEISISGMLGGASVTNAFRVWSYVKSGKHNFPEVTGQPPIAESIARFNGYETPYSVDPDDDYVFWGRDGTDIIHGYNGDDIFFPKGGHDIFDGGPGDDIIVLSLTPDDYSIGRGSDPTEWHIRRQLDDGSVELKHLKNVETVAFETGDTIELSDLLSVAPAPGPAPTDEAQLESSPDEGDLPASRTRRDVGDWISQSTDEDDEVVHPLEGQPDPDSETSDIDAPPASSVPPECAVELGDERWLESEPDESDGLAVRARRAVDPATASPGTTEPIVEDNVKLQWRVISETASVDSPPGSSVPTVYVTRLESPCGRFVEIVRVGERDGMDPTSFEPVCWAEQSRSRFMEEFARMGADTERSGTRQPFTENMATGPSLGVYTTPSSTRVIGVFESPSHDDGLGA